MKKPPRLSASESRRLFRQVEARLAEAQRKDALVRIVNALADMMPQFAQIVGQHHISEFYDGVKDLDAAIRASKRGEGWEE